MCDSGFLENFPGQEEFKIFEIAEYYVEPNSAPYPVSCIDDCNCLDTYYKGVGFQLGSHNDLKYDEINRENYVNTRVVNFNSEICSKRRQICASGEYNNYCKYGNFHIRALDSLRITNKIKWLCPMDCYH